MSEEKDFLSLQKVVCKPKAKPDILPEVCPDCVPNPNFIPPSILESEADPFYNEATCEYSINFLCPFGIEIVKQANSLNDKYSIKGIENYFFDKARIKYDKGEDLVFEDEKRPVIFYLQRLCEAFNKTTDLKYLVDGAENEEKYTGLENAVVLETQFDGQDTSTIYMRISVPKLNFERLPNDDGEEQDEDDEVSEDGKIVLKMKAEDFIRGTYKLRYALNAYSVIYKQALAIESGYLYKLGDDNKTPISPQNIIGREKIKAFVDGLQDVIEKKGYKLSVLQSISPFPSPKVDEIKLVFDNSDENKKYKLRSVSVAPHRCKMRRVWKSKGASGKWYRNLRANALIAQIEQIDYSISSEVGPTWYEFYETYYYPTLKLQQSKTGNPLTAKNNPLNCAINQFGDFNDFLRTLLGSFEDAFEFLSFEIDKESCRPTVEVLEEENEKNTPTDDELTLALRAIEEGKLNSKQIKASTSLTESEKKQLLLEYYKQTKRRDLSKKEKKEYREINPNSLKNLYKKELDPKRGILEAILARLGGSDDTERRTWKDRKDGKPPKSDSAIENLISTISLCELSYLFQNVLKCLLNGVPFDQAAVIIIRSSLKSLTAKQLGFLFATLPLEKQQEIQKKINVTIDTNVEPWSDSWANGNYKDAKSTGKPQVSIKNKVSEIDYEISILEEKLKFATPEQKIELEEKIQDLKDKKEEVLYDPQLDSTNETLAEYEERKKEEEENSKNLEIEKKQVIEEIDKEIKQIEEERSQLVELRQTQNNSLQTAITANRKKINLLEKEIEEILTTAGGIPIGTETESIEQKNNEISRLKEVIDSQEKQKDNNVNFYKPLIKEKDDKLKTLLEEKTYIEDLQGLNLSALEDVKKAESENEQGGDPLNKKRTEQGVIGAATQVILDAYIEAIMDSFRIDELLRIIDKSPVAKIGIDLILGLFGAAYCPTAPLEQLTNKYLSDLSQALTTFKYEPCTNELLTIPELPNVFAGSIKDLLKYEFRLAIKKAIKRAFNQLIMKLIFKAIRTIDDILCRALGVLGNNAFNSIMGRDNNADFLDLFGQSLCKEMTPEEAQNAMAAMMNSIGLTPNNLATRGINPTEATQCLSTAIASTVSRKEVLRIMAGLEVSDLVYVRMSNSLRNRCPDIADAIGEVERIKDFFDELKKFIAPDRIDDIIDQLEDIPIDESVCDLICLNNEALDQWDNLRRNSLIDSGMDPDDAADQVNNLNDIAEEEIDNFVNASNNLQDIIADEIGKLFNEPPPGCEIPEDHPLSSGPKADGFSDSMIDFMFDGIENSYYSELSGKRKSIMSMILQDTKANSLVAHRFFTSFLGTRWFYKNEEQDKKKGPLRVTFKGFYPQTVGNYTFSKMLESTYDTITGDGLEFGDLPDNLKLDIFPKGYSIKEGNVQIFEVKTDDQPDYSFLDQARKKVGNATIKAFIEGAVGGYKFGYKENEVEEEDFDYLNPDGITEYNFEEEDRVLGVSRSPEKVIYLNPAIHGGRYTKPKIYVVPPKQTGWMRINDIISQPDEPCEGKVDKTLNFNYLKEYTKDLKNKIPYDKRLAQDKDCQRDLPFDHIADPETLASISGLVKATIQVYAMKEILPLLPILSQIRYTSDEFGRYVGKSLSLRMKEYIMNELRMRLVPTMNKRIKWHRYWFLFLEQAVETYQRELELGLRDPHPSISDDDLTNIKNARLFYPYPNKNDFKLYKDIEKDEDDHGINTRNKAKEFVIDYKLDDYTKDGDKWNGKTKKDFYLRAALFDNRYTDIFFGQEDEDIDLDKPSVGGLRKLNFILKNYSIYLVEKECRKILNVLIGEQIEKIFDVLSESLEPKVYDLNEYMFHKKIGLFKGSGLNIGLYSQEKLLATGQPVEFGDVTELFKYSPDNTLDGNFIVEKYVRINEKENGPLDPERQTRFKDITRLSYFKDFLRTNSSIDKSKNLSDYFGSFAIEDGELTGDAPARFGIRVCWVQSGNNSDEIEKTPSGYKTTILDSFEYDMLDEKIEDFLSEDTNNKYDIKCLISNLANKLSFKNMMNLSFSRAAIIDYFLAYHDLYFFSSIGLEDGWEEPPEEPDEGDLDESQDNNKIEEAREKMFQRTFRVLVRTFESVYKEDDFEDEKNYNADFNALSFDWLKSLIPELNFSGFNLIGWKRRKIVKEIEECDEDLKEFLENLK